MPTNDAIIVMIQNLEKSRHEDRERHHTALDAIQKRIEVFDDKLEDSFNKIENVLDNIYKEQKKTNGRVTRLEINNESLKSQINNEIDVNKRFHKDLEFFHILGRHPLIFAIIVFIVLVLLQIEEVVKFIIEVII